MNIPANLKYTESHEWIRAEADGALTIGITDHAQEALGDLVFIELPQVGRTANSGDAIGVVESVKAASDIYAPVAGEVIAVNTSVTEAPDKVNADPYGNWLYKIKPANATDVEKLLDAAAYTKVVANA